MRSFFIAVFVCFALSSVTRADTILFEDFEDSTVTYTYNNTLVAGSASADDLSDIAAEDYFGRIDADNTSSFEPADNINYTTNHAFTGSSNGFFGVQDTDGTPSGNVDTIVLEWNDINISNFENLNLSWFVAEDLADDGNNDWDTTSEFRIEISLDNGAYTDLFAIASELGTDDNETNEAPRVDTDFDGTGDGTFITDTFAQFDATIANGNELDIRVFIEDLDTGDEDIAFDNLWLQGDFTAVPEPGSFAVLSAGLGFVTWRRRKRAAKK